MNDRKLTYVLRNNDKAGTIIVNRYFTELQLNLIKKRILRTKHQKQIKYG
ncbi:hypothetical protein Pedsa_2678 [Pseudopedobacter saltans DSM 12145]|uniref:Uncharacterized protein n=1 Tax=Pseudopedobacter saltans (strain ATCC 51119 / DSM 12145 / JCM 21818 / CCUG 39354 / LMG 10337 / NBRC 100064 / NCIMB 13643) TaxID=762903 RepID=F0S6A6_PSESL|nr:hypothetical protein Pedsa_2678 [Pseudopedobacter saltans DSM 12145]